VIMLHHLHSCHPINVMVIDHISMENRIWGDRNGTELGVMLIVQGFVRSDAGSLWLVIIPKSKTGSWSYHP
jgi:hypothetical protein